MKIFVLHKVVLHKVMIAILFCMQFCHVVTAAQGKSQPMTVEKAWNLLDIKKADREDIDTMDKLENRIQSIKRSRKVDDANNFEDAIVKILEPEVLKNFINNHSSLILNIIKNGLEQKKNNDDIFKRIKEHYSFQEFDPNIVVAEITKTINIKRQESEEAILDQEKRRKKQQEDEERVHSEAIKQAGEWMDKNSDTIKNMIAEFLQQMHNHAPFDIENRAIWDYLKNKGMDELNPKNLIQGAYQILHEKINGLIKETKERFNKDLKVKQQQEIEKTKRSQPQSQPEPQSYQKQSEQNPSAKPNEHRLSKAAWVDYSGAATTFVVQRWLNDHYGDLKKNITFFLKRQFDNDFLDVNKEAVWENSIKEFVEKTDSYNKMDASDKHILKNKIFLIITEIEQNLKKEISIKESRENELRRRQQQAAFNPNDLNMVTAALELASMLKR